jgi:hypothetical protein
MSIGTKNGESREGPTRVHDHDLVDHRRDPTEATADRGPDALRIDGLLELRVPQRLRGCADGQMSEPIRPADLLTVHVLARLEPADLPGHLRGVRRRIEASDAGDAALSMNERVPHRRDVIPDRCDRAKTCYHDVARLPWIPTSQGGPP